MPKKAVKSYDAQVSVRLFTADLKYIKKAFSEHCRRHGLINRSGSVRSLNDFYRASLLKRARSILRESESKK